MMTKSVKVTSGNRFVSGAARVAVELKACSVEQGASWDCQ